MRQDLHNWLRYRLHVGASPYEDNALSQKMRKSCEIPLLGKSAFLIPKMGVHEIASPALAIYYV